MPSRCPECAGKMTYNPSIRQMVCNSCGLSLSRYELDGYWKNIREQHATDIDDLEKKKNRKKEWLDWWSSKKD
jgi:hypothetical protein